MNILIIKHGSIGDFVMSIGAIISIRNKFPNKRINLLTTTSIKNIFFKIPYIDQIYIDDRKSYLDLYQYLIKLKNVTGYKSPIPIQMINDSNEIISEKWINGFQKDTTFVYKTSAKPSRIAMDYDVITTDYNYKNHMSRINGIFKLTEEVSTNSKPSSSKADTLSRQYSALKYFSAHFAKESPVKGVIP